MGHGFHTVPINRHQITGVYFHSQTGVGKRRKFDASGLRMAFL